MNRVTVAVVILLAVICQPVRAGLGFAFVHTGKVAPELVDGKGAGVFGVRFISEPELRFHPRPAIPKSLKKHGKEGYVRVALLVGEDGRVQEIKLLEASPKGQVEKDALRFFKRVVYVSDKGGSFETDAVLVFRNVQKRPSD